MALMPTERMGPPARSFAADAHDCIMVRIQTDRPHTSLWREERCAPMASSPRIITQTYNGRHQTREIQRKAHLLSIVPPRAQGSRRCETQASLRRQAAKAPLAFRSLDPFRALREPDCRRRDEKRPFPLRTKNFSTTQNNRLTGKAPYKSGAHLGRRRCERLFCKSGDLGNALCRRSRPGRRDALRAGPL
jgi:hypothetical protein